ncbi:Gag-Pol polyprotein [Gossypium australe]|uniref:Gag-Pol polyprotein n=1 Tax=Gossypium australe TaxID=47621 RepID=A0A5B6WRX8_9ROSI|nr:Gag-Pol polyprotein [Gossypium australe]
MNKPYHSSSKKSRDSYSRSNASDTRIEIEEINIEGEYILESAGIIVIKLVSNVARQIILFENAKLSSTTTRGRPPRNTGNVSSGKGVTRDSAVRSEARVTARAYAIHAREEASSPDVIIGTFSLYDTNVIALIDPGSTRSYICMNLVFSKSLPVDSTKFVIKVSNPLGKYVLVDKVCKNCPLMTRGYCFSVDMMLLPFDEFDVILGMNWLTMYDAINNEILRIESDESNGLPVVISSMSTQKCVRKGCEAYFAYILDTKVTESKI